jgi:peptidoglycan/LPS O-acetylase OafA/YrhL
MNFVQIKSLEEEKPASLHYRPDIDGLRAVAVMAVLAYHAFPQIVPGGFVGVDIFFVISGYLITGIIQRQMLEKRFSITAFYAGRIRRIFPALILVVLVTFAIGWFVFPPWDMQSLGTNIAGSSIFAQNFVLLGQVGYFDIAASRKPLLHLWSLGIEEQFYIVWPVTLLLVRNRGLNAIAIVGFLTVASFIFCMVESSHSPELAFYWPFTRAWELFVGSALALWQFRAMQKTNFGTPGFVGPYREIAASCAILSIVLVVFLYSPKIAYPGYLTLVPVLAAAVLIGSEGSIIHRRLLSAHSLVFVGLISYPLYLWHFPLMAYARSLYADGVPPRIMFSILALSVFLAWATYRFVERPIRFGMRMMPGIKIGGLAAAMVVVGLIGLAADKTDGLPIRYPSSIRGFLLTSRETQSYWRLGKCMLLLQDPSEFTPDCAGSGRRPLLLIWGDSYAAALYPGLDHFSSERGYSVAQYNSSACAPLIGYDNPYRPFCKSVNDFTLQKIAELKPDVVILDGTWRVSEDDARRGIAVTVSKLKDLHIKKIVVMGPVATWGGDGLAANVLDYYRENSSAALIPVHTWYRTNDDWTRPFDEFLGEQTRTAGAEYISTRKIMCNADGCLTRIGPNGSELVAFDTGHLTIPGSVFMAGQVMDRLLDFKQ